MRTDREQNSLDASYERSWMRELNDRFYNEITDSDEEETIYSNDDEDEDSDSL